MLASSVRATVWAMSKGKLQPSQAPLTVTPSAANKIKQLLKDKREHIGLKVGVQTRAFNKHTLGQTRKGGDSDEEGDQDEAPVNR
uniref:Uncharacterized protein n=1 Tax=Ursus americanus TaxID=9643 RepID=A0A452QZD0_URSAM